MLANTITIDTTGQEVSPVTYAFSRYDQVGNRSDYHCAGHSPSMRHQLQFYRSPSKRNGESFGVRKAAIKYTRDFAVDNVSGTGTIVMPLIFEISVAIPEGVAAADLAHARILSVCALLDPSPTPVGTQLKLLEQLDI